MTTITRVQGNARGIANSGTVITATLTNNPTAGNTLVCTIGAFVGGTVSTISQTGVSWNRAVYLNYGAGLAEIWYGTVSDNASKTINITFDNNLNAAYAIADVCEYSGLKGTLDQTATNYGTSGSTTSTGTTGATTEDDELFIGAVYAITNGGSQDTQSNPQNGFTLLDGAETYSSPYHTSVGYLEKIVSTRQAATSGTTVYQSANWRCCIATFKGGAKFTIGASAGSDASISPTGNVIVYEDEDQAFTISANTGYHIAHVYVDGVDQGSISTYTFNDVTANHTIFAAAETNPTTCSIIATADSNSTITPSGTVSVNTGSDQQFNMSANTGYHITHVYVDSVDQGAITTYTFATVIENHTIFVTSTRDASALQVTGTLIVDGTSALNGYTVVEGDIQTEGYKASDGTDGATSDVTLSTVTTLHFKNGLLVGTS